MVVADALALPPLADGGHVLTRQQSPTPAVVAMVTVALATTVAWWVGVG